MQPEIPVLSDEFRRLYCDAAVFEGFSALHPVSFTRVLPFQVHDLVMDHPDLLTAETNHLSNPDDATRLAVVDAFGGCGLLSASDVTNMKPVIDHFDADFFEFMGEVYANAGMFSCALRWHREFIAEVEERRPSTISDNESVYASVGYCLYSLGMYPEAITWSKSCVGPRQTADTVSRALIDYEAQMEGGCIRGIERVATRTRYTVGAFDPAKLSEAFPRLKLALSVFTPVQETYIDCVSSEASVPGIEAEGYPFQAERDASELTRHRMNLIFALCGQADALIAKSYTAEAKQLLIEAALLEPRAEFVSDRLRALP